MVREAGFIAALRRFGRQILPQSRFRTLLHRFLLIFERRTGVSYVVAGERVRFHPYAAPHAGGPLASEHEQYDAIQLEAFARAIAPGNWVADVGAYRGEYTTIAAQRVGAAGRVFAFEPTEANARFIHLNLDFNDFAARAELIPKAVSDRSGHLTFFIAGESTTNSTLRTSVNASAEEIVEMTVEATTLDETFPARLPDVVKIDVEGAEWRVLRGADRVVRSDAIIFCELHPWGWTESGDDPDNMRAWLKERGREIVDLQGASVSEWRYGPTVLRRVSG